MQPNVMEAIRDGFKAANKSWAGIGVYAGMWAALIAVTAGCLLLTNPPPELFEAQGQAEQMNLPAVEETASAESELAAAPAEDVTAPEDETSVFDRLDTADALPADAPDAFAATSDDEESAQVALDWLARAWPAALFCALLLLAGSAWAQAGQLGYVAKALSGQVRVADFWQTGAKAFRSVLAAMALMLAADALGRLLNAVLDAFFLVLSGALPRALMAVLALLVVVATLVPLIWIAMRLSFWFPAIVVSGLGPIAALRDSFRVTRSRWWRVTALRGAMLGIALGAVLIYTALVALGSLLGQMIGTVVLLIGTLGLLAGLLYGSFAFAGADVRFYQQAREAAA